MTTADDGPPSSGDPAFATQASEPATDGPDEGVPAIATHPASAAPQGRDDLAADGDLAAEGGRQAQTG